MLVTVAAIGYAVLMGIVILFQFCLAIGMPWGEASMGGKFPGKYPPKMRVVSVINILVLSFLTLIVLIKADLILPEFKSFSDVAVYFVAGFSVVAVILNSITPSKIERNIWAPVTSLQLIMSIIVAFIND
jgi:hypothetical protein